MRIKTTRKYQYVNHMRVNENPGKQRTATGKKTQVKAIQVDRYRAVRCGQVR